MMNYAHRSVLGVLILLCSCKPSAKSERNTSENLPTTNQQESSPLDSAQVTSMAIELCSNRQYAAAIAECKKIPKLPASGFSLSGCMFNVGWCLQKSGQTDLALEAANEVNIDYEKADLLGRVGVDYIKTGQAEKGMKTVKEAIEIAERIQSPEIRPHTFAHIGQGLAEAGQHSDARAALDRAAQFAKSLPPSPSANIALQVVGKALAHAQLYDEAMSLAEVISDNCNRYNVSFDIALSLRAGGQNQRADELFRKSLESVKSLHECYDGTTQSRLLAPIAENFAKANQQDWSDQVRALIGGSQKGSASAAAIQKSTEIATAAAAGNSITGVQLENVAGATPTFKITGVADNPTNIARYMLALQNHPNVGRVDLEWSKMIIDAGKQRSSFSLLFEIKGVS